MPTGIYKRTEKHKRKLHILAKERGYGKWMKGKKLSTEHKRKIGRKASENSNWKGGKYKESDGYILIYKPNHPFCNCRGYIKEHRLVMEKKIDRYLKTEEVVHHIDGIKDSNYPENLMLFPTESAHQQYESAMGILTN